MGPLLAFAQTPSRALVDLREPVDTMRCEWGRFLVFESQRRHRRLRVRDVPSPASAIEAMEARTMLSAGVDQGDYFWSNGEQVSLLRDAGEPKAITSSATVPTSADSADTRPVEFLISGSGTRVRLTDEIYVRLNGTNPQALFTADNGFSGFTPVPGTSDQFVATASAGAEAALDLANASA